MSKKSFGPHYSFSFLAGVERKAAGQRAVRPDFKEDRIRGVSAIHCRNWLKIRIM